ncbi:unnamed protein product, partial [Iphiclides podalirius]
MTAVHRQTPHTWCTRTIADSYWTPSRCAKILIDKDVPDLPADSFIFAKGAGCRWLGAEWWCAVTPPRALAAVPPVATTTSPFNCRQLCAPLNLISDPFTAVTPPPLASPCALIPPNLTHLVAAPPPNLSPAPLHRSPRGVHIDRGPDTLGKATPASPAAEAMPE